jgi:hypothetical protein
MVLVLAFANVGVYAQVIPSPGEYFGFEIGEHRKLADWGQLTKWYEVLAKGSPRVTVDTLGSTTLGAPFVMLTVTSEDNQRRIEQIRDIQLKLADPRRISDGGELERLLDEGKTVVLITHGIHATEVGGPQTAARLLHRLATSHEDKVRDILDNVVLLDIPSLNPDGLDMVIEWYRKWVGTEYEGAPLPKLYHYYVGHDHNRDWYAFTQIETELTVTKAHNAWHPQIVHDIHQMGSTGPRIFFPPFIDPWEPNIDPLLTSAVNQLGSYMAAEVLAAGLSGVGIHGIYDAFTPARAYQHYHAGARILSETASARLATPITLDRGNLGGRRGLDASRRTWNFPEVWEGGEWGLPDIVDYMEAGAMALLTNAARNRRYWLENFYRINEKAVAKWPEWPNAWVLPNDEGNVGLDAVLRILTIGDVEVHRALSDFTADGKHVTAGDYVIPLNQPYASFANTMLERQVYPDLRQYPGGPPQPPYDVVAHTLPLLMNVEAFAIERPFAAELSSPIARHAVDYTAPSGLAGTRIAVYKSWNEPMPEGWTRWVLDQHDIAYDTLHDADIHEGMLERYDVLLFEDQSAGAIVRGYPPDRLPAPYSGGLRDVGVEAVKEFVTRGGRVIAVGRATDLVIDAFSLPISNRVADLRSSEFYVPGSILRVDYDTNHAISRGLGEDGAAWYWGSSRAFDIDGGDVDVVARYGKGNPLLSGWILGGDVIAGEPAVVETRVGDGSIVLFGFPPNYRGQTIATWPLLFNAMTYR